MSDRRQTPRYGDPLEAAVAARTTITRLGSPTLPHRKAAKKSERQNEATTSSTNHGNRQTCLLQFGKNTKTIAPEPVEEDDSNEDEEDEEEDGTRYNESNFQFDDFAKRLPHPKIIRACGTALKNFESNSVNTNHCIVKLLHRIAFDCKMYVMVFQLSIFRSFQKIFAMKDLPQHKELVKFATYIVRQFVKVAEINKKVFMEAIFWKSTQECYDIEHGYTDSHGKKTAARAWSEEEEDEVRRLFMEHQQSGNQDDVVDWVTSNLIDQTKSRRQVLKKLKELMLLIDYRGKKKSGVSRPPKTWTAEEEANLQELFDQFKDSDDPLGNIMDNLDVPRPKNRVSEKLLVMGLIRDKKEIRKKRSKHGRKSQATGSDNESSPINTSDDDAPSQTSTSQGRQIQAQQRVKKRTAGKKRPIKHVPLPKSKIAQMIMVVMNSDEMRESLEWLKESLGDAIEDYEVGNNEGIPLVPVMDYAEAAMENVEFQELLKALGVCPPFDEQEVYWRIPIGLTPEILQTHCDMIQQALDNTLQIEPEASTPAYQNGESSEDDDVVFARLRTITNAKTLENNEDGVSGGTSKEPEDKTRSSLTNDEIEPSVVKFSVSEFTLDDNEDDSSVQRESRRRIGSSDDEVETQTVGQDPVVQRQSDRRIETSDDEVETQTVDPDLVSESPVNRRKSRNVIESDSDEEKDLATEKRLRSTSNSDSEKPVSKRGRIIDSDED